LIVFYLLKRKIHKKQKQTIIGWLILLFISIFFITPYSFYIWKYIPFINQSGSQRLLITVAFYMSLLIGYLTIIAKHKTWLIYGLILLAIGTTILNWGQRRVIPTINDATLRSNLSLGTTWADEHFYALPKWVSSKQLFFSNIPTSRLDILDGKANVKEISRSSTVHTYRIDALSPLKIRENTLYFPGWNVTSNGKQIIAYPDSRGIIEFILPTGIQYVNVTYEDIFPF
jgi:hypothetical protein